MFKQIKRLFKQSKQPIKRKRCLDRLNGRLDEQCIYYIFPFSSPWFVSMDCLGEFLANLTVFCERMNRNQLISSNERYHYLYKWLPNDDDLLKSNHLNHPMAIMKMHLQPYRPTREMLLNYQTRPLNDQPIYVELVKQMLLIKLLMLARKIGCDATPVKLGITGGASAREMI